MDPVNATVISCLYGDTHDQFVPRWTTAIEQLDPAPVEVIVGSDSARVIDGATVIHAGSCAWHYPQSFYLQAALEEVTTDWVWIVDIDDVAFHDALAGVCEIEADVFQMGYVRSDGEVYIPPVLDRDEILFAPRNPFVAGSCIRTEKLRDIGGFPDVALQDWALWRQLARGGATFAASTRPRFGYVRHQDTRGRVELTATARQGHLDEMFEWEAGHAVAA